MSSGQGYLDWQRNDQQIGGLLLNLLNQQATPTQVLGPFSVGVWAALAFILDATNVAGQYNLLFEWFADQAATQPMGSATWTSSQGARISDQCVNMGAWVRITISSTNGAGAAPFTLRVTPMSITGYRARQIPSGFLLKMSGTVIGPGATVNTYSVQVSAGPAMFYVASLSNVNYIAYLETADTPNQFQVISVAAQSVAGDNFGKSQLVYLPPGTMLVSLTNNSGGNGTFECGLVPIT